MKSIAIGSNLAISPLFTKRDVPCSLLSYFWDSIWKLWTTQYSI